MSKSTKRPWLQRMGIPHLAPTHHDIRDLKVRYLGPSARPFTGVCDQCGMAYTAYWSHRQTIQHLLAIRLRKQRQRNAA